MGMDTSTKTKMLSIPWLPIGFSLAALVYTVFLYFAIRAGQAGVDYSTFMTIGQHWVSGQYVYIVNSYYPMPYVALFAFFSQLPQWLSMFLWLGFPVILAVLITGPWVLFYAPLFAHFVGGQTALFGMLGLYGYRHYSSRFLGGALLALTALKPQLAVFPVGWALVEWVKSYRQTQKVPASFTGFIIVFTLLYLPSFLVYPSWPLDWLASPRPLAFRAMAGLFPRALLLLIPQSPAYFTVLLVIVGLLIYIFRKRLTFQSSLYLFFLVCPFVHDYDLIQLLPVIHTRKMKLSAVLLSIPTWIVICYFYNIDAAWFVVTLLPLGLLILSFLA